VLVVVVVLAYILVSSGGGSPLIGKRVSSSDMLSLEQIANNNTLANKVGAGIVVPGPGSNLPKKVTGMPLTAYGKPEVFYVGGDYCPYCAVTRWGLILALMRFGNFTSLEYMQSSPTDYAADTPTFSFTNASYSSTIVHFDGLELTNRSGGGIPGANLTAVEQLAYNRYAGSGGIPFIDFGNTSVQSGASVSPVLIHRYTWSEIIRNISVPGSEMAQGIIGNADVFTAAICASNSTINATASVCKQPYVKKILG
jgi:hypothetical protein